MIEGNAATNAKAYRTRLRREVNMHIGVGRSCQSAPLRIRLARAVRLWERATGYPPPADWTYTRIIDELVQRAYPTERNNDTNT